MTDLHRRRKAWYASNMALAPVKIALYLLGLMLVIRCTSSLSFPFQAGMLMVYVVSTLYWLDPHKTAPRK